MTFVRHSDRPAATDPMLMPSKPPIIAVKGLTRDFPPVRALDDVSLAFESGMVHGLIGENGAGKSTLMNVLSGLIRPTAGRVLIDGRAIDFHSARDAQNAGIAMIHQELNLVPELSVADNIFLGRESRRMGLLDRRGMAEQAAAHLASVGSSVDPRALVGGLSIAQRQMVEIAKALSQQAKVIIMDEPTAVLTRREVALLFDLIARLRGRGVAIIYISHVLSEVLRICDRISVLRDGRLVTTRDNDGSLDDAQLAGLMVGREMTRQFPQQTDHEDQVTLKVQGLSAAGGVHDASFELRRGEILGFAGLIGAGRTELAEAVVGLRHRLGGEMELQGRPFAPPNLARSIAEGVTYLSEDRQGKGVVLGMPVTHNTTLASLRRYCHPLIHSGQELAATEQHIRKLGIRVGNPRQMIDTLSGGNQQKVALARWLEMEPAVLILDEPTRGVDVGAKAEIYRLIAELAARGLACMMISSELHELMGLCHRIAVMRGGRIVAIVDGPTATEEQIMHLAAGVIRQPQKADQSMEVSPR